LLAHDGLHSREFGAKVNKEIGRVVRRNIGAKRRVQLRVISKCVVRSSQPVSAEFSYRQGARRANENAGTRKRNAVGRRAAVCSRRFGFRVAEW